VTINVLPDDVLLEIFVYVTQFHQRFITDHDLLEELRRSPIDDRWITLVHVCKRWRFIVFASPRRLKLRILCTNRRPVRKKLDIWPRLPVSVFTDHNGTSSLRGVTNIMAALKQHKRVRAIYIKNVPNSFLKRAVLMRLFPALRRLLLWSNDETAPELPDSFLGGSAPRLRIFTLKGIPFPGLRKLLLSTANLVFLSLTDIPPSGYISPEAVVVSLSTLTRLEKLFLKFRSPRSRAVRENRRPLPLIRVVLPALRSLCFKGDSEYIEDIMSRIEVPLLYLMDITFFNQLTFDTPELRRLINCIGQPQLLNDAYILFTDSDVFINFFDQLSFRISCKPSDWQVSSLTQLCNSTLTPLLATLERLVPRAYDRRKDWHEYIENVQWLELLQPFAHVKDLDIYEDLFRLVAPSLDKLAGERVIEVLPALQNIFLRDPKPSLEPVTKAIEKFASTRRLLGRPVAVHYLDSDTPLGGQ
jgi:hypothetical protein